MENPMMNQLGQTGMMGNLGKAKEMFNNLRAMGNPQIMLNNAMAKNPQLKAVIDECGGDYQKAFYRMAEMQGVNPEEILNVFR